MGSQIPTSSDRSRTYWTPPMERYFIDLMLDQMHRGNKIGHTFNKIAWADMLTLFNAKFGSQYDKDVLKSRYTSLWRQFNDIKILLEQSDFAWDETRQMVTADDYVWDAYIKAHPDARSYRTKTLLNYNDLCMIFGYTTADGRYSRSSHDVDFDDDVSGVKIGDGMGSIVSASAEHSRTDWTLLMDSNFIELMLDQLHRGNKVDHTFNKQAWTDMITLFNEKFSSQYGKRVLRHRYKKLWKYCNDITVLLDQNGFTWDETQHKVSADDDVWDAYIKAHPHARLYRTKTFPNYKDACVIYGNAVAGGRRSHLGQDKDLEDDVIGVKNEGKESQTATSSDRSRTYWTPPMDRYFIELLLDQVHGGNKIGHTFITQAWMDMVTLFNAKFGSQHDKDVLKNRYKHLRRQYNEIKTILGQSGFSWDETLQMVTADDHIWDAYIKAHPDARSYRIKTVPNYNNLCLIYGNESADGRYSRLARDIDLDDDGPILRIGEGADGQATSSSDRSRTDWTPSMDHYFINLMLEQVHKGNKFDHTFNKQAWTDMITSFNAKFGSQHDKDVLRSRYKNLRKQYNDMKSLLEQNGFAWDETRQMVTANDDVWDAYIKEHPGARSYRTKTKPNYIDLCVIYGNSIDGGYNHSGPDIYLDDDVLGVQIEGKNREAPISTDRSRTDWTPPMDRYFIDLMLEQVHRGNMIDHKFNKQAWNDMITLFNAKFGSQHDKDVLRSRYKNLRKRYNDMKILLDQSGFSWDEARQIVTADDDVWDTYIKAHPDARSYRTKTMPNYKDLCLIYGNATVGGRSSHSAHDIDFDDDILGVMIGDGNDDQAISSRDLSTTGWTPPMYCYFIELMLEQVQGGNKSGHTFNELAWMHMIALFNAKFSSQYGKDFLKSQYENLRKQYNDIKILLNQSEFAWGDAQQMITEDDVWATFIKAHPDSLSYRTSFANFKDLSIIFENGTADGGESHLGQDVNVDHGIVEMENGGGSADLQSLVIYPAPTDVVHDVLEPSHSGRNMDLSMSDQQNKRQSATSSASQHSRKVQRSGKGMLDALSEMADVVTSLTNKKENKNSISIENVITELQAVPEIDDDLLLDACDLLEDEKKAKTFMALDVTLRKKWLLRKLRP